MSKENTSSSIGFLGLLALAFIVLKLTDVIGWSWWWVTAPLWMPVSLICCVGTVIVIFLTLRSSR